MSLMFFKWHSQIFYRSSKKGSILKVRNHLANRYPFVVPTVKRRTRWIIRHFASGYQEKITLRSSKNALTWKLCVAAHHCIRCVGYDLNPFPFCVQVVRCCSRLYCNDTVITTPETPHLPHRTVMSIWPINEVNRHIRIDWLRFNWCSPETFLYFDSQEFSLSNCYCHQDLH